MSLRDRLRRREPAVPGGPAPTADGAPATEPTGDTGDTDPTGATAAVPVRALAREDVTDFDPRSDGDYHCVERGLYLRFARPAVTETSERADDAHPDPARGEFTQSGRFVVQRRFGRPVVYTVLERRPGLLTVRRTDTSVTGSDGTDGTAELQFTFEPDDR